MDYHRQFVVALFLRVQDVLEHSLADQSAKKFGPQALHHLLRISFAI